MFNSKLKQSNDNPAKPGLTIFRREATGISMSHVCSLLPLSPLSGMTQISAPTPRTTGEAETPKMQGQKYNTRRTASCISCCYNQRGTPGFEIGCSASSDSSDRKRCPTRCCRHGSGAHQSWPCKYLPLMDINGRFIQILTSLILVVHDQY